MKNEQWALAHEAASAIAQATGVSTHHMALTLGSGWAGAAELIGETVAEIPASRIPGFSTGAIAGHTGTLRSIRLQSGRHALVLGARTHYYEDRDVDAVAHGVRTACATGARIAILTNGCGSTTSLGPGTVALISDHINLTAASPLKGPSFVDLTDLYSARLRGLAREIDPELPEGVYAQFPGPHYETPAEVAMARLLGADLVGMSTALEAIAAREADMEVLGISLVTNYAAGIAGALDHREVVDAGRAASDRISSLLARILARIDDDFDEEQR